MNPPKPSALRALQGNPGKRPLPKNEPKVRRFRSPPPPPERLGTGRAHDTWVEMAELLVEARVLTMGDRPILEGYCMAYERLAEAEADCQVNGVVLDDGDRRVRNPATSIVNEAGKQLRDFSALLGLDPSSRTRISVPDDAADDNPFAVLMGGKVK